MENPSVLHGPRSLPPVPCRIDEFFSTNVQQNGDGAQRCGITCGQQFLSYADLHVRAERVQHNLHRLMIDAALETSIVAIDVQPSNELIACLLGVLKTGAAFLPTDSHSAINRVRRILNEVKPVCIVIDSSSVFSHDSETVWSSYKVVDIEVLLSDNNPGVQEDFSERRRTQDSLAAVIYTSGSTGDPKGVMLMHRTIMNRLHWQWKKLPFQSDEVCCFKTSLLFVDSLVEIFGAVLQLQPLVIAKKHVVRDPESLVDLLAAEKVTRLALVPSLLRNLLLYLTVSLRAAELSELTTWTSNSETLRYGLAKMFFQMFHAGEVLYNLYGSTESMADITYERFDNLDDVEQKHFGDSMSLGKPLQNSTLYILDENLTIIPGGEIGQIGLSGHSIAEGYLNQSAHEDIFISNPFRALDEYPILFLSGDFGRIVGERVAYEGRRDSQVKIRGRRVNIMEIDKVIGNSPFVSWSHVLCHQFSEVSNVIVAYYKAVGSAKRTKIESDITMRCQQSLPCYMRPKLVCVSDIPLQTHSGKIDGIALRKLYEKAYKRQSSRELTLVDEKSRKIMNILALNLNLPTQAVCSKKSFFELGGNSVNMVSSIVQLQQHNLHTTIEDFSRANTIQEIINGISDNQVPMSKGVSQTKKYTIKQLNQTSGNEGIVRIFTESFVHKEPLDVLLGVTSEEFKIFAQSLYNAALKNSLSLIVTDSTNGEVVAGDFLFDYHRVIAVQHHQSMAPILRLMKDIEDPVRERLTSEGRHNLLYNYCLCVDLNLRHDEQVRLCHLMEGETLKIAAENGFSGVLTNNTNPVTQDICEHFFGYQVLSAFKVQDFVFNGRAVFSHAPEEYYVKMMIRYL